ncbi:MAG TPA: hypothetical protein VFL41_08845 [Gaiellaceae bacterium]|nr:hypothetical protein [Gaiellaceae bacterium]
MKIALSIAAATLLALGAATVDAPAEPSRSNADCARTSTGLVPVTDFTARRRYKGYTGGLYPNVRNRPTAAYLRAGVNAAKRVRRVASDSKFVLLSLGMVNTTAEFQGFKRLAEADPLKNPNLVIVDGAQAGWDAEKIKRPRADYWEVVEQRLTEAGATPDQVQAIWLKQAIAGEDRPFPRDAKALQNDLRAIVRIARSRYPNVKLIYLSSRTYGGYAITGLNPEPFAYESAFGVRWLIGERMRGKLKSPWLGWGPYLWTDGLRGRKDGLTWECQDVEMDGTLPSKSGVQKVAQLLLQFFKSDPTARPWFVRIRRPAE